VPLADFVTPNEIELGALVEEPPAATLDDARRQARLLLDQGAHAVVAKRGAEGALLVTPDRERLWPAPRVAVLDTTAAGDCWNGAFAAGLAVGQTEDQAGRLATEAAALSVTRLGAQPSMPTRHELDRFLRSRQEIAR
jgi:ribokinase